MDFNKWIKLILVLIYFNQINLTEGISRNFLRGMTLGVMFGRNIFSKQLNNNMPMHPAMPSCQTPKPKCPEKHEEHHEEHHETPVKSTYPVYVHHVQNPSYFFKYAPPLQLDDHSLNEFLNENRRLLEILRS